ncbi:EF-hand domain-containing protein [Psychroserpens burtonensis]|uniref:EF-hand domain-containing protein n=1 Tax=Psychroserpens burtonensis TaxID=49278 RepID=A0A5C7BBK0_9FLAO|nr:EF-hand domain-containing protein [Psychroserpens burtonensis]TXE20036.1 EF-hand domain-containing protein [Psychroserpens burtonensis]
MKSNTLKTVVLVFGIALFMSNYSFGQSQDRQEIKEPPTFKQLLKEMDKNEDGQLSKAEVKGPLKDNFTEIDTNEDGYITKKELEDAPKPERKERKRNKI